MLFPVLAIPTVTLAFVAGAVASRRLAERPRRLAMWRASWSGAACLTLTARRFTGNFDHDFAWALGADGEDRLLAQATSRRRFRQRSRRRRLPRLWRHGGPTRRLPLRRAASRRLR